MRRLRSALCALCLALLVPLIIRTARILPLDTGPLVAEKYAGWSGVLRLWVFEGWSPGSGSLSTWLNRCISRFEKRNPGVYIQPQYVDSGAIASMNDSGILPPDMLMFPPGLLTSPAGLAPLSPPDNLRAPLNECGVWGDMTYAVPVAMGGYLWAWNAALIQRVPDTWRDADGTLAVPPPEAWRRWDAALLALCSGRYSEAPAIDSPEEAGDALPGLDLGLAAPDVPTPTPAPSEDACAALPCRLPDGFQFDEDAWRHFTNGEAAALPVTQREIRRLQALSDQGKGPDWRLDRGAGAFTDQLLCFAAVDKTNAKDQRMLCAAFLSCLLEDDCQSDLFRASAFSVTNAESGYAASDPLTLMDAALRDPGLRVPGCFDGKWQSESEAIVREFIADAGESWLLWRRLGERLGKNPNN